MAAAACRTGCWRKPRRHRPELIPDADETTAPGRIFRQRGADGLIRRTRIPVSFRISALLAQLGIHRMAPILLMVAMAMVARAAPAPGALARPQVAQGSHARARESRTLFPGMGRHPAGSRDRRVFREHGGNVQLVEAEGVEHVQAALARNRGVILLVGHFTSLEMSGIGIDKYVPGFVIIQNPRRSQLLTEVQRRGRARFSDAVYSNRNARALLRSLRNNAAVLIAADEADTSKSSILLPFFGHPALANTSVSRIATISGASVVPLSYCRAADDSGYRIRFYPALEDFPSNDIVADTERLIAILEAQIRECPGQYFWKQRRFRSRESSQQ
jgi:lauroyl/myristoyl acyltransferase